MTSRSPTSVYAASAGFGLIGMLVLLLTLSLATAALFVLVLPTFTTSALKTTSDRITLLRRSIADYKRSHGASAGIAPSTLAALITDDGIPCLPNNDPTNLILYRTLQGWCGPYIGSPFTGAADEHLRDGWGKLFTYVAATQVLTSCGPNRTCGDSDDVTFSP